jgi:hypothetical protein
MSLHAYYLGKEMFTPTFADSDLEVTGDVLLLGFTR